jgi:hypothetical protein
MYLWDASTVLLRTVLLTIRYNILHMEPTGHKLGCPRLSSRISPPPSSFVHHLVSCRHSVTNFGVDCFITCLYPVWAPCGAFGSVSLCVSSPPMGKTLLSDYHPTTELPTSSSEAIHVGIFNCKRAAQFPL